MADNKQIKTVKGPAALFDIHSSGRTCAGYEGKTIYLDFGIPDEEVTFITHRRKQAFRSGEVVEVIKPSPHRTDPFCEHFRDCGGCPWQHITYSHQLFLKRKILLNALEKYGIIAPPVPEVLPSPSLSLYRHRVEFAFSGNSPSFFQHTDTQKMGFHKYNEPVEITDINQCFLQDDPSRNIAGFIKRTAIEEKVSFYDPVQKSGSLRSLSIRINKSHEALVILGFNNDDPEKREMLLSKTAEHFGPGLMLGWTVHKSSSHSQLQGEIHSYRNHSLYLNEQLGNLNFRIHASSFFQPNSRQAENIFQTISYWAGLKGTEKVYDLYTGIGTIALFLASTAGHVLGIEGSPEAIKDANYNTRINNISNADFLTGDILDTFTPHFLDEKGKPDVIVLDPPRSGTLIEIKKTINTSGARKVIYLSCNPVSLAFDLKQLTEVYHITRIQPFDMLPHTHHLETLVMLEK